MTLQTQLANLLLNSFQDPDSVIVDCPRNDDKHFVITIKSTKFTGLSRIDQNKLVYKIINPLFQEGNLHAVTLNLSV